MFLKPFKAFYLQLKRGKREGIYPKTSYRCTILQTAQASEFVVPQNQTIMVYIVTTFIPTFIWRGFFSLFLANRRASDDNSTGAVNDGWEVSATPTGAKRRNKKRWMQTKTLDGAVVGRSLISRFLIELSVFV